MFTVAIIACIAGVVCLGFAVMVLFAEGMAQEDVTNWPFWIGLPLLAASGGIHAFIGTWPWFAWPISAVAALVSAFVIATMIFGGAWANWFPWAVTGSSLVVIAAMLGPIYLGG